MTMVEPVILAMIVILLVHRHEDYGRIPPKKLKRLKELIDSGLKNPKAITQRDLNEVTKLFLEAGGELPPDMEFKRGRLRWLNKENR